jgi:hypothetical protein
VAGYNGTGDSTDAACALAVDNSGNVYVTGKSYGNGTGSDYATIKYDSNGNQLWVARYNNPIDDDENEEDAAYALAIDDLGNVYVTGTSTSYSLNRGSTTIKYDPNGNELWVARFYQLNAKDLAVDNSGNVYVTGKSSNWYTGYDYTTVKYDSNGNQKWVVLDDTYGDDDCATAIELDTQGNVYVTGEGSNYATIKYTQRLYCIQPFDGDMDGDCRVDYTDLALLAQQWLDPFDFTDYATLAEDWLECNFALEEDCW